MAEQEVKVEPVVNSGGGKGSKMRMIIIIIIVLLLIGAGAGAFFIFFGGTGKKGSKTSEMKQQDSAQKERAPVSDEFEKADIPEYFYFREAKDNEGQYLVNLKDGKHFLSIKIVAEIEHGEEDVKSYLEARRPMLDDMIIEELENLNSKTIEDPKMHDQLEKDLKIKVNSIFDPDFLEKYTGKGNPVKRILITKFIVN